MKENKKKHHYVWKEYLRSWTNGNDKIYTLLKSKNEIIHTNLVGVVQKRYYYSLEEFTIEEEIILHELVKNFSTKEALTINLELFKIYTSYSRIKRQLLNESSENISEESKLNDILNLIKTNLFEEFHTKVENKGNKIIKIKSFEEFKNFQNTNEMLDALIFICFQYLRTQKMKNNLELSFKNSSYIIPKYSNLISLVFATSLAISIASKNDLRFIYYENKTDLKFITSDQPLMNLKIDKKDEKGFVKDFELYYPISPKIAILIHFNEISEKYAFEEIDLKKIKELNDFVYEYAEEFVFSDSIEQLRK